MEVVLQSSDGATFSVSSDACQLSGVLVTMIQDIDGRDIIPFTNINGAVLAKIIDFLEFHESNPPPVPGSDDIESVRKDIEEWEEHFFNVEQDVLFSYVLAANYLDIAPLLTGASRAIADLIRGRSPQDIRNIFNIQNEFTAEEEEQIRQENEWTEEQ